MSQFMQIDIRVIPFYEVPFEKRFPRLVGLLRGLSYQEILKNEISFYDLVDTFTTIFEHPDTPAGVREQIAPYVGNMEKLKDQAREHLLARRLNELDQTLYRIEDQFEDLEGVL